MSRAFDAGWRVIKGENPLLGRGRHDARGRRVRSQPLQPATTDPTVESMRRRGGRALKRRASLKPSERGEGGKANRREWDRERLLDSDFVDVIDQGFGAGTKGATKYYNSLPLERRPRPGPGPRDDFETTGAHDDAPSGVMGDARKIPSWIEPKEQERMVHRQNRMGGRIST